MTQRRINFYVCDTCGGSIFTIDRDEGVTPMFLACRAIPGCRGTMQSAGYPPEMADYKLPTFEWFRPDEKVIRKMIPDMQEHIRAGGLDLRQIGFRNTGTEPFQGEMMTCCVCGKTLKSHPRIESNWTALELDSIRYYACSAELPLRKKDRATSKEFGEAYKKIMLHITGQEMPIGPDTSIGMVEHRKVGSN